MFKDFECKGGENLINRIDVFVFICVIWKRDGFWSCFIYYFSDNN